MFKLKNEPMYGTPPTAFHNAVAWDYFKKLKQCNRQCFFNIGTPPTAFRHAVAWDYFKKLKQCNRQCFF
jgi:hypothetical protein